MEPQAQTTRITSYRNFFLVYGGGKFDGYVTTYEQAGKHKPLLNAMFLGVEEAKRAVDWRWAVIAADKWVPIPEDLKAFKFMDIDSPLPIADFNRWKSGYEPAPTPSPEIANHEQA